MPESVSFCDIPIIPKKAPLRSINPARSIGYLSEAALIVNEQFHKTCFYINWLFLIIVIPAIKTTAYIRRLN